MKIAPLSQGLEVLEVLLLESPAVEAAEVVIAELAALLLLLRRRGLAGRLLLGFLGPDRGVEKDQYSNESDPHPQLGSHPHLHTWDSLWRRPREPPEVPGRTRPKGLG